jgi:hypothetical protein
MKTFRYIIAVLAAAIGLSACVDDLNVKPIDPSMLPENEALTTPEDYLALLGQCYTGFATSGSYGPNGANNISGVDGGFSQYFRGRYHLNGLTTDEAVCGWNDQTLQNLHGLSWTTDDVFVAAFYYRIFYQLSALNNFIRYVNRAEIELPEKDLWIAEARTLRALCWLDAIDNYGNVPFADENTPVGMYTPEQISRDSLFNYIEADLKDVLAGDALYDYGQGGYGRANKGLAAMILAKLYLNAEVYVGKKMYQECADVLSKLEGRYSLHTEVNGTGENPYQELFLADNNECTEEIIWAVMQDGLNTQSYGVTNYLIFASTGGDMNAAAVGISSGWGGLRTTPEFYDKFEKDDMRKLFYDKDAQQAWWEEQYMAYIDALPSGETQLDFKAWVKAEEKVEQKKEISDISTFTDGYAFMKFRNVKSNGDKAQATGFVDVDFPVFRYADALLMLAECELRGAELKGIKGQAAFDTVRKRAGLATKPLTLDAVLDERACELYQEGWRRSDLIRFGRFTSDSYLWSWKGGAETGQGVGSHMALFPIPDSDRNANPNLDQNEGY